MKKRYAGVSTVVTFILLLGLVLAAFSLKDHTPNASLVKKASPSPTKVYTPTPSSFGKYTIPVIQKKPVYKIVMIGDSMTAALGPHGGGLSEYMNTLYKEKTSDPQRIIIDNFAKSSNILAVNDELTKKTTISEYTFGPLLSEDYDLILVESYGYNPLSQFGITGGLQQQNLSLDRLMRTLTTTHPHAVIVFVATIAPNKENYAKRTQLNMSDEDRTKLVDERVAYIKNHIAYAEKHHIPLINIYEKSLTQNGDGDMKYINPTDDIHPSFAGVDFIDYEIGNYIYDNKILLK